MTKYIYLSGGMSTLSLDEQLEWRIKFQHLADDFISENHVECFIPPYYYNYKDKIPKSEREAFEYDLYRLRHSDILVVNFNVPKSIGTAYEIAVARENKIPIIGINANDEILHPWLVESCLKILPTIESAAKYVEEYLI
jgi:nucleoside 2-deoxyribosyltransferase